MQQEPRRPNQGPTDTSKDPHVLLLHWPEHEPRQDCPEAETRGFPSEVFEICRVELDSQQRRSDFLIGDIAVALSRLSPKMTIKGTRLNVRLWDLSNKLFPSGLSFFLPEMPRFVNYVVEARLRPL